MNVVYASDDKFAEIMGVSILSLLKSNKAVAKLSVYILASGITQKNKERVQAVFHSCSRPGPYWIDGTDINLSLGIRVRQDRGSVSQYARLFLSGLLPHEMERVLYLDCDTLVLDSLSPLWSMDMKGKTVAALLDPFSPWYRRNLGLKSGDILFNSGVMLIDLKRWRAEGVEKRVLQLIKTYKGLVPQGDQGALNAILSRDTTLIHPRFNAITLYYDLPYDFMLSYRKPPFYYSRDEVAEGRERPAIVHFTTSFLSKRPWLAGSQHPYATMWLGFKGVSPWKEEPLRTVKPGKLKGYYLELFHRLPFKAAIWLSGLLQAYGRPLIEKIRYGIRWGEI